MKNSPYWKQRFEQLEAASNKDAVATFNVVQEQYISAEKEIEKQISTWYKRFAKNNQVSMAEARRLLTTGELAEFKWDVKEFIKYGHDNEINPIWMKELENASAKFHISRLEALKIETQQTVERLFGGQTDEVDKLLKKNYLQNYYHTVYEVQKGFNIGWDIAAIDDRTVERLISKPWATDAKNFSDRIWSNKSSLINEVQTQLTRTFMLGKSPDDAIDAIAKKMKSSKNQAGRLVMTESAYFSSQSQKDAFNSLDVERFEIVATLDSHTSAICQELDGHVFDMKNFEPGITAPPFHPWCRTTTVPYFEDNFTERAARGEDGKTYYVDSKMNYKDWKKTFVDGGSKKDLKPNLSTVKDVEDAISSKKTELTTVDDDIKKFTDEKKRYNEPKFKDFEQQGETVIQEKSKAAKDKIKDIEGKLSDYSKDLDKFYQRPERGSEAYDEWKAWKDNFDADETNTQYYKLSDEKFKLQDDLKKYDEYFDWKSWQKTYDISDTESKLVNLAEQKKAVEEEIKKLQVELAKVKNADPKEIAGVLHGKEMTIDEANHGKPNPNYTKGGGYTINCQSCVVSYEARLRGYDVQTLPNLKGSKLAELSRKTNLAWIDPTTGTHPAYIFDDTATTVKKFSDFLEKTVEQNKRYTIEFSWKGRSRSGHIISMNRGADGALTLYDPQIGRTYTGKQIDAYIGRMKFTTTVYGNKFVTPPKILRVDDKMFNLDMVNNILEGVTK